METYRVTYRIGPVEHQYANVRAKSPAAAIANAALHLRDVAGLTAIKARKLRPGKHV